MLFKLKSYLKKWIVFILHKIPSDSFFNTYLNANKFNQGFIIALHRIHLGKGHGFGLNNFIEISSFKLEEIILNLKKLNVKFVSLHELSGAIDRKINFDRPIVHFSIDDGYQDNFLSAFEIFKRHQVSFSIFITTDFINHNRPFIWWYIVEYIIQNNIPINFEKYHFHLTPMDYKTTKKTLLFDFCCNFIMGNIDKDKSYFEEKLIGYLPTGQNEIVPRMLSWKEINEMLSSGLCELGVHTKDHARFANLEKEEKIKQIIDCKRDIQINTGINSEFFAYPYGSKEDIGPVDDLEEIMTTCGIKLAFTTIPAELNISSSKVLMPRILLNEQANMYTLKTRINGSYQRGL